uniref:Uncharacterized protein n=1 Tax=Panagrolaimus sp. PS1159 TaxID=55785 RepID=A0AC35FHF4_9BILA
MFTRSIGNASLIASKISQNQVLQCRLLNASAVTFKEKKAIDKVKENAQNLGQKAKTKYYQTKEKVAEKDLDEKFHETYENAKEKLVNAAKTVGGEKFADSTDTTIEKAKDKVVNAAKFFAGQNFVEHATKRAQNAKEKVHFMATTISGKDLAEKVGDKFEDAKDKAKDMADNLRGKNTIDKMSNASKEVKFNAQDAKEASSKETVKMMATEISGKDLAKSDINKIEEKIQNQIESSISTDKIKGKNRNAENDQTKIHLMATEIKGKDLAKSDSNNVQDKIENQIESSMDTKKSPIIKD